MKRVHFELEDAEEENHVFPKDSSKIKDFINTLFNDNTSQEQWNSNFQLLLAAFGNSNYTDENQFYYIVSNLSKVCTQLNESKYNDLVTSLLSLKWLEKSDKFIKAYSHLLLNMVSAQCQFMAKIAEMLVDNLRSGPEKYPNIPVSFVFDQTHSVLIKILNLIPLGPSFIFSILSKKMPHKSESTKNLSFFCSSLLHITEYLPSVKAQIFGLILELLVEIDADIPFDQLEEELLEEEDEEGMFDMEMEENLRDSFAGTDESDDEESEEEESDDEENSSMLIVSDTKSNVQKLDALICMVMDYIFCIHKKSLASGDFDDLSDVYDGLLQGFNRTILPTYRIRSTQFIIFYTCSLVPDVFSQDFLGLLISHLISTSNSSVSRISSASYLGSFIARAKFVDLSAVRQCLLLLNQQCQAYLDNHEATIRGQLETERYGVLYAAVQAILYIFCFRWRQVMIVDDQPITGTFPPELKDFQRVLVSKFSPLRVCSEAIVQEFAKITHQLNIIYCYPLMSSITRSHSVLVKSHDQLQIPRIETYFPFDPLVLSKSKKYVHASFQEWGDDEDAEDTLTDPADSDLDTSLKGMSLDDSLMSMSMSLSLQ